jgi:hypothetical protein
MFRYFIAGIIAGFIVGAMAGFILALIIGADKNNF